MERTDETLSLRDYVTVIRQQRRQIAVVTLVVTVLGLLAFLVQTPEYRARAELQLERVRTAQDISLSELLNPRGEIGEAEIAAAGSLEVAEEAAALLGRDDPGVLRSQVGVSVVEGTQRLRFDATDTDPETAAQVADAFATAFIEYRREQAIDSVAAVQGELEQRAAELRTELATLDAQIDEIAAAEQPAADPDDEAEVSPELESLQIRRQAVQAQLAQVILRSTELGTSSEALTGFSAGFTPANVPSEPIGTDWVNALGVAFVFGLALGIGLAFVRDHFDDVLRNETDLKRATGGLPVLGRIPAWQSEIGNQHRLVSMAEPSSHAAEAYRELSAGVRFLLVARAEEITSGRAPHHGLGRSRSVMVSSANIGEGKTATAANLAVATARVGLKTILVDADLRRSAVGRRFGLPAMQGLSDALLNGEKPEHHLVDVGVPHLGVLTAGATPPNPTELLASPAMRALHHRLLEMADLVIYDTPAILAVADALEVGPFVDLGIIVGRVDVTTRRRLQAAVERLEQVGADLAGSVLNGLGHQSDGYYYESYDSSDDMSYAAPLRGAGASGPADLAWSSAPPTPPGSGSVAAAAEPTSSDAGDRASHAPRSGRDAGPGSSVRVVDGPRDVDEPLFGSD